jgi:rhamnogalacturonyl hydrolase YesR
MQRAADWQMAHLPADRAPTDWTMAAYDAGLTALANISPNPAYLNAILQTGALTQWKLGKRLYFADDQAVAQTYLDMYERYHEPAMLAAPRAALDAIIANPAPNANDLSLTTDPKSVDNWSWCDALFMGPPIWTRMTAQTGDPRYLDWMNAHFWQTVAFLYDRKQHLFYRDSNYFTRRETNGQPVFWGRGNGWVLAGIARVLQTMPNNYAARPRYVELFRELAARLVTFQDSSGAWHASLLDPKAYPEPEMSATGLIDYGLAWGVNAHVLDAHIYKTHVIAGWNALASHVQPDGMLGFVQPHGRDPQHTNKTQSEVYGTGGLLLAGSELFKMQLLATQPHATITITSPLAGYRFSETVTLGCAALLCNGERANGVMASSASSMRVVEPRPSLSRPAQLLVMRGSNAQIVDSQLTTKASGAREDALLFQTDIAPNATQTYVVVAKPTNLATPAPIVKTFARFVPGRQDDFAWENDRIAHRVYGPALARIEGTNNSGIDVWVKSVRRPIVDELYKGAVYHVDHGEGGDFYDNGTSRGDGGSGIWSGDTLYVSNNYATWKLVSSGPIRAEFILTYTPWLAGNRTVSENKRFILDAGSNMTRVEETFASPQRTPLTVGIAVVSSDWPGRHQHSKITRNLQRTATPPDDARGHFTNGVDWIADFQSMSAAPKGSPDNGMVGVGAIVPPPARTRLGFVEGHEVLTTHATPGIPLVYYVGAGWSKFDFPTQPGWQNYVTGFATRLASPLRIHISW